MWLINIFSNLMLWILLFSNLYQIKCECEIDEDNYKAHIKAPYQKYEKCTYNLDYDEIAEKSMQIISNTSNQTQIYEFEVTIQSEGKCYNPQLVIDFDTTPLRDNPDTYYSFYIFDEDKYWQPMIENYMNMISSGECLNISKRILKTNLNEWAVIDSEYKKLFESQKLNDKTNEIRIKIKVGPNVSLSCNEFNKFSLNAIITLKCSSELIDWSFDFEDIQTISTFAVALCVFSFLWAFAICSVRCSELEEQYKKLNENKATPSARDLFFFGCGYNKRKRYYAFISYDDDGHYNYALANTWIWYVLVSLTLAAMPVLLSIFENDFTDCKMYAVIIFLCVPFTIIHLLDYNCCTAHWFGQEWCIKKKIFERVSLYIQNKSKMIAKCSYFVYAPIICIMTIFHVTYMCADQAVSDNEINYNYCMIVIPTGLVSLVSISFIPFILYWVVFVIISNVMSVTDNGYSRTWSIIFAGMPISLIFLGASAQPRLNRLLLPFVGLTVSLYDAFTDINLIILWYESRDFRYWAILQIVFILMGQLVGAIDEYGICGSKALNNPKPFKKNICGCLCTAIGGRIKYGLTIADRENEEPDTESKYEEPELSKVKLNDKETTMQTLKINEMVWESLNSVALQLYIATVFNQFNGTLLFSLATSFANVTDSLYHLMENGKNVEKTVRKQKWVIWISWVYIVTDFLYRIIPNIALSVLIDQYHGKHHESGDFVFYLAVFILLGVNIVLETYVLGWRNPRHICLSLVSSSYLLLGVLGTTGVAKIEFQNDHSTRLQILRNERVSRLILCIVITVICLLWQVVILTWPAFSVEDKIFYSQIIGLVISEFIVIFIHLQMVSMFDNDMILPDNEDTNNPMEQNTDKTNLETYETREVELVTSTNP